MITYLASPYSVVDPEMFTRQVEEVMVGRELAAAKAAAKLMLDGHTVFSPIVHSHRISDLLPPDRRLDHEFWLKQDLKILAACGLLVVLMLEGWEDSKGVEREIAFAREHWIPIMFMLEVE